MREFAITFLFTYILIFIIIKIENSYGFFTDHHSKSHAVHKTPTPRVGGLGIFIAFTISNFIFIDNFKWLIISSLIVFLIGILDDWHGDIPKQIRLLGMSIGTFIAVIYGNVYIKDIDFFHLPYIIAVPFTIFAVVGICSAMNFIDGLNGLASGVSITTLSFYCIITYLNNDILIFKILIISIGAINGFFIWNFPKGKIFLGDGGAYFLGFLLAIFSVIITNRDDNISTWYPLVAMSYPIIETFVTIWRRLKRKKKYGTPFFQAEKMHLHTLMFKRNTRSNSIASFQLLVFHLIINIAAFIFYNNLYVLILIIFCAFIFYLYLYIKIVYFGRIKILKILMNIFMKVYNKERFL